MLRIADSRAKSTCRLTIDIIPRRAPNRIQINRPQKVPVLLYGSADLNVLAIDLDSVGFGPGQASPYSIRFRDDNRDGTLDVLLQFIATETGIQLTDDEACLSGILQSGSQFAGCDAVVPTTSQIPR